MIDNKRTASTAKAAENFNAGKTFKSVYEKIKVIFCRENK